MAIGGSGLMPREHGAYAQLAFPLLTGLAYGRFHPGAIAFAVLTTAAFLAHEPVAVIAGVRGVRLQGQRSDAARRRLVALGGAAVLALLAAIGLAPLRAWIGGIVPAVLALGVLPLFGRRGMKSIGAEVLVALAFAATVLPLGLAGPVSWGAAAAASGVWAAAYLPAILAVHAVKVSHKGKAEGRWTLLATPLSAALVLLAAVAIGLGVPGAAPVLAAVPPAAAVLVVAAIRPHPRHLKRIGWTMVAADSVALILLLAL